MLKAVFFDAAGTLFEAREPVGHTYARIAARHGVVADDAKVTAGFRRAFSSAPSLAFGPGHDAMKLRAMEREWWRRLVRRSFEGLGAFDDFEAFFDELFSYFADPASWESVPEAQTVLRRLRDEGLRLGIISNFDHRLYRILDGLGLSAWFDSVTISSEAGFAKPSLEIFARALNTADVSPREALHVGDSEHMDVAGARAAGISAALVGPGIGRDCEELENPARIASLASVIKVVQLLRFA